MKKSIKVLSTKEIKNTVAIKGGNRDTDEIIKSLGGGSSLKSIRG